MHVLVFFTSKILWSWKKNYLWRIGSLRKDGAAKHARRGKG